MNAQLRRFGQGLATIVLFAAIGVSLPAHATPPVDASIWPALGKVQQLQAEFVQVQHRKILKRPLESRGRVSFGRPASLVWSVLSPAKSTFTLEGTKATMDVPDVGSHEMIDLATVPDANRLATSLMVWLQADASAVDRDFSATYQQAPPAVALVPKDSRLAALVSTVTLDLAESPWRVAAVHFTEPTGDSVDIRFRSVVLDGAPVPDPAP